jgi:hypothetical protein
VIFKAVEARENVPEELPIPILLVPLPRRMAPSPPTVKAPEFWVNPVTPERAPLLTIRPLMVLVELLAVMVPPAVTFKPVEAMVKVPEEFPIPILLVPVPKRSVPVPLAFTVKLVFTEEGEITGFSPEKVRAEAVKVLVLYVPAVISPPAVTFKPPLEAMVRVPEELPIPILPVPVPRETVPDPSTKKAPEFWVNPVTEERAPLLMTTPLMVFPTVGATMDCKVLKAPVLSKKDWVIFPASTILRISGVPVPVVPLSVKEVTPLAVGATVLAAVVPGTFTRKSLLVISEEAMVAKAGAPSVVALKY